MTHFMNGFKKRTYLLHSSNSPQELADRTIKKVRNGILIFLHGAVMAAFAAWYGLREGFTPNGVLMVAWNSWIGQFTDTEVFFQAWTILILFALGITLTVYGVIKIIVADRNFSILTYGRW